MMRYIRSLFGNESKPAKSKSRRPVSGRRLGLEGLESRDLMALAVGLPTLPVAPVQPVAPAAVTISISNQDLVIRGTDGPDDVKVSYQGSGKYLVTVTTIVNGRASPQTTTWKPTGGDVFFYGNKGDDTLYCSFSAGGYLQRLVPAGAKKRATCRLKGMPPASGYEIPEAVIKELFGRTDDDQSENSEADGGGEF